MVVADTAATIAYETNLEAKQEAMDRFTKMNNGPMQVIGDDRVTWTMSIFETCMYDLQHEKCKDRDLKALASLLIKRMRAAIAQSARLHEASSN